jgi:uroporphyrinogen-III decarboxylase
MLQRPVALAQFGVAAPGNFDPCWLYASPEIIRTRTRAMLKVFDGPGYIVNLRHGILPDRPPRDARRGGGSQGRGEVAANRSREKESER